MSINIIHWIPCETKSPFPVYYTLVPKSFDYQFMATMDWREQETKYDGDDKRGEKGIPKLQENYQPN